MSVSNRTRQLSDLRADVVFLADLPTPTTATHITTQNLTDLVNAGIAEMYNEIVKETGEDTYRSTATITTVNAQTVYPLPADFLRLISVELTLDSANKMPLHRFTNEEAPFMRSIFPGWDGNPVKFQVQGKSAIGGTDASSIEFLPIPVTGKVVTIYYVFAPPRLVNASDVLDGFSGFEDYAVLYATRRCLMRQGRHDEAASFTLEAERVKGNILDMMKHRTAGDPAKTRIVRDNSTWTLRWGRW